MNQVSRVSKETIHGIEDIARNLHHPGAIWIDSHSGDMHRACAQFDHKKHHNANGPEHAEGLYGKEVARIERLPMTPNEVFPRAFVNPFRRWLDPCLSQNIRNRRPPDLDLSAR